MVEQDEERIIVDALEGIKQIRDYTDSTREEVLHALEKAEKLIFYLLSTHAEEMSLAVKAADQFEKENRRLALLALCSGTSPNEPGQSDKMH